LVRLRRGSQSPAFFTSLHQRSLARFSLFYPTSTLSSLPPTSTRPHQLVSRATALLLCSFPLWCWILPLLSRSSGVLSFWYVYAGAFNFHLVLARGPASHRIASPGLATGDAPLLRAEYASNMIVLFGLLAMHCSRIRPLLLVGRLLLRGLQPPTIYYLPYSLTSSARTPSLTHPPPPLQ
jgi:hypothetical protein